MVSAAALAVTGKHADQSMSDSDSGSDSDLETISLAAAARASNTDKARNGNAIGPHTGQIGLSPQQTQ